MELWKDGGSVHSIPTPLPSIGENVSLIGFLPAARRDGHVVDCVRSALSVLKSPALTY